MRIALPAGILCLLLASCSTQKVSSAGASSRPVSTVEAAPVQVARVVEKEVPVQLTAIGNVSAYATVSVKSQVTGQLKQVAFKEGQSVKTGDLLFEIDPRPFQAALDQATANLDKGLAQEKYADAEARRYAALYEDQVIPKEQYDQYRTNAQALRGTVEADRAAVENAQLQLGYTTIRSPVDGRTGSLLVQAGNVVTANDTSLVMIDQIRPIYVSFSVPAENLSEIRKRMHDRLRVEATPNGGGAPAAGRLTFVDNNVNTNTGTILLKGTFQNENRSLWPGQFVDVVLTLYDEPHALLIPSAAVQEGQQGQYVFVVKPDLTAESQPVVVGETFEQQSVITSGLRAGEMVVTDGQLRLSPGAKVRIVNGSGEASQ